MTFAELKAKHAGVLGTELTGENLLFLREGMVLYGGSLANSRKPRDEQAVLTHGFRYAVHVSATLGCVDCLGLSSGGRPTLYTYSKGNLSAGRFLFRTKPVV